MVTSVDPHTLPLNGKPYDFHETAEEMARWQRILHGDSPAVELRVPKCTHARYKKPHTRRGYFDPVDQLNLVEMAKKALVLNREMPVNCYTTLNPVHPDLLSRCNNREDVGDDTASDTNIVYRRWILVDLDPKRLAGISSTDDEKSLAFALMVVVARFLDAAGWPTPIVADSGNGWHLLYRIDLPADDGGIVERVLKALAARFDTDGATVDTSVFNASRITKFYGTISKKGDHTPARPWRRSKFVSYPENIEIVPLDLLESLAACAPAGKARQSANCGAAVAAENPRGPADAKELKRIRQYMAKVEPAVSGQHGHSTTLKVANILIWRWALPEDQALALFLDWNQSCEPPWDETELRRKLVEALKNPIGEYGALRKGREKPSRSRKARPATKPDDPSEVVSEDPAVEKPATEAELTSGRNLFDDDHTICNAIVVKSDEETITEPICMESILDRIRKRTGGWPRRVGTALFAHQPGGDVQWLLSPPALFGYLGATCPPPAKFSRTVGCHSREEVFAELQRTAKAYEAIETLPHEPTFPTHYYCCSVPESGDGKALRALIERFSPATEIDSDLLTALFVTPAWGGKGGSRPAFTLTSDDGRGSGKTTLAAMLAYLWGGAIELSANENAEIIKQRLLSPEGFTRRVVLLDNVKTLRFSWAELESLITAPVISGKRMYVGEGTRPNNLTWVITLNGASYSTDMAQRSVFVKIRKPAHSGSWSDDTRAYIDANRQQIITDAMSLLRSDRTELQRYSRWGAWERDILSRLPEPADAQRVILERQNVADVELEESDIVEDYFRQQLAALHYSPDVDRVFLPSQVVCHWFNAATNERHTSTAVSRTINQKINERKFHALAENKCRTWGRGFVWVGNEWSGESDTKTDVETRLDEMKRQTDRRSF